MISFTSIPDPWDYNYGKSSLYKYIEYLFREKVCDELSNWDYYIISDSGITIHYHYWSQDSSGIIPIYNQDQIFLSYCDIKILHQNSPPVLLFP